MNKLKDGESRRTYQDRAREKQCGSCKHFDRCKSDIVISAKDTDYCHWGDLHKLKVVAHVT